MFVLRDFDPQSKFDKIVTMIKSDLEKIWKEIAKPEAYANSQASDFFSFDFYKLPHKIYAPEDFEKAVNELGKKFDINNSVNLFSDLSNQHLPSEAFAIFMENLWKKIRSEKELNLVCHI